jgi:hypothetical protein
MRLLLVALALLLSGQRTDAQSYSKGQSISPAFEGWEQNPDGSFNLLFGYMNRNWEEEVDVPVGPDNAIEPGGPDQSQPTHFLPRRNRFIFKVRVPKEFGDKEMIWTLTTKGKTEKAYATLRPDYKVDDMVIASETGALGAGTSSPEVRANTRPVVTIEDGKRRTVRVGQPLALVAVVADDGVPKPRRQFGDPAGAETGSGGRGENPAGARGGTQAGAPAGTPGASTTSRGSGPAAGGAAFLAALLGRGGNPAYIPPFRVTVGKTTGLHLSWFVYRGAAKVSFDPLQVKVWEDTRAGANSPWAPLWTPPARPPDGKWIAQAIFDEPGTYVLRARADDGALYSDEDVTVTVTR